MVALRASVGLHAMNEGGEGRGAAREKGWRPSLSAILGRARCHG